MINHAKCREVSWEKDRQKVVHTNLGAGLPLSLQLLLQLFNAALQEKEIT